MYTKFNRIDKDTAEYNQARIHFKTYNKILKNEYQCEKGLLLYFFTRDQSNTTNTWNNINEILSRNNKTTQSPTS